MATIPFATGFNTGLTTMGFTLLSLDGSEFAARSVVGVSEVGPGRYTTTEVVADTALPLVVQWDDGAGGEAVASITNESAEIALSNAERLAIAVRVSQEIATNIRDFVDGETSLLNGWDSALPEIQKLSAATQSQIDAIKASEDGTATRQTALLAAIDKSLKIDTLYTATGPKGADTVTFKE